MLCIAQLVEKEINPYVDKWEADHKFPAHEVFLKLGKAGLLGVNKPTGRIELILLYRIIILI